MLIWKSLENKIREAGGFVNAHAHFDRAYTLTPPRRQMEIGR